MKIIIYRYAHPIEPGKWLYTGQTANLNRRDKQHRLGFKGFGKRYKKVFSGIELPPPDFKEVEISSQIEANEIETIEMFINHTWCGQGGFNLQLPGADDYTNAARQGGLANVASGQVQALGRISGRKAADSGFLDSIRTYEGSAKGGYTSLHNGHLARVRPKDLGARNRDSGHTQAMGKKWGPINAKRAMEEGFGIFGLTPEQRSAAGKLGGGKRGPEAARSGQLAEGLHNRWHVNRNIISPDCRFCKNKT